MADNKKQYRARVDRAKAANNAKFQNLNKDLESGSKESTKNIEKTTFDVVKPEKNEKILKKNEKNITEKIDKTNLMTIDEDAIQIEVPDNECLSYGRPPKYMIEKGISYIFKKALNIQVIYE